MFHAIRQRLILFICFIGFVLPLQAAIPNWSVDASQYQYSMNFNAQVVLNGASAPVGNHLVGVFVGSQCRGLASPMELNGKRYYFITIFSNLFQTKNIYYEEKVFKNDFEKIIA